MNKTIKTLAAYLGIISVPIILIFLNIHNVMFDENWYHQQHAKDGIYDFWNKSIVDSETHNLLLFYKGKQFDTSLFNEKEKGHLNDVKGLYDVARLLFYSAVIVLIGACALLRRKREIVTILKRGALLAIIIVLLLILMATTDFTSFFTVFHKIVFANNNWMLNPETDNLIVMFPESFFIAFVTRILVKTVVMAVMLLGITSVLSFRFKGACVIF